MQHLSSSCKSTTVKLSVFFWKVQTHQRLVSLHPTRALRSRTRHITGRTSPVFVSRSATQKTPQHAVGACAAAGDPLTPSSGEPPLPPSLRLASDHVADADSPTATIPTCWGNALCFLFASFPRSRVGGNAGSPLVWGILVMHFALFGEGFGGDLGFCWGSFVFGGIVYFCARMRPPFANASVSIRLLD